LKRNSLFAAYILTIAISILVFNPSSITTNMLTIFQHDKNIEKLEIINSFEASSTLFIVTKGFDQKNIDKLLTMGEQLKRLPYIKNTKFNLSKLEVSDYIKKNYYLLNKFTPIVLDEEIVYEKLEEIKVDLMESFIYQPIDKNDPLKLFTSDMFSKTLSSKDGYLSLGEYGYLLTAQIDSKISDIENAKMIEEQLSTLFKDSNDVLVFSNLFFTAQNSTIIKSNVHTILYLSFALLILLFFITLKDARLLIANMITLTSSIFVALSISTILFDELSIFTLAFGSAISSISVDYLFHNYFHGQYKRKGINKTILIAFITTALGFLLLQFITFPLISQLSTFALISLSFSYFQFTFIYPYLKFSPRKRRVNLRFLFNIKTMLPVNAVFIFSLLAILYASMTIEFDYDLKNLDYDNKVLKEKQSIILKHMPQKTTILIEADTVDGLIEKAYTLQEQIPSTNSISKLGLSQKQFNLKKEKLENYDFEKLKQLLSSSAKELGFKEGYFNTSYDFTHNIPNQYSTDLKALKSLGYEVLKKDDKFYTIATINIADTSKLKSSKGIYIIDASKLMKNTIETMISNLLFYIVVAFFSMVAIITFFLGKKTIFALNFILFPMAVILVYLSFISINIMHLFSIIIIVVAGIDYGIYMSQTNSDETKEAIFYSLFTSFAGFGVLVLSNIGAIYSIGIVITLGVLSILFLILFLNKFAYNTKKDF